MLTSSATAAQEAVSDTTRGMTLHQMGIDLMKRSLLDSSLVCFGEAREFFKKNEAWGDYVESNNFTADALARLGRFNDALKYLHESQKIAKERLSPNDLRLAHALATLAYIESYNQEYARAISDAKESLRIRKETKTPGIFAIDTPLYLLAATYRSMGLYDEAIASINDAIAISKTKGDEESLATYMLTAGNILSDKGDYHDALCIQDSVLSILRRNGKARTLLAASCYFYQGRDYLNENRINDAISSLLKALDLDRTVAGEILPSVQGCLEKLGEAYSRRSDYDQAIAYINRAIDISIALTGQYHSALAGSYLSLADLYSLKNDFNQAIGYARKSLQIEEHNRGLHHVETANCFENLGDVFARHNDFDSAITMYASSLVIKEELDRVSIDVARLQLSIGNAYAEAGKIDSAEVFIRKSFETFQVSASGDSSFEALFYKSYGDLLMKQKKYTPAREEYEKAVATLSRPNYSGAIEAGGRWTYSGTGVLMLRSLTAKAQLFKRLYQESAEPAYLDTAYVTIEEAINVMTILRRSYKAEGSRLFLREEFDKVYKEGVETALTLYAKTGNAEFKEKAFECAERAKSNLLRDKILETEAVHFSGAPDSILEKEASLKTSLTFFEEKIQEADKSGQSEMMKQFRDNYFAASFAYNSLLDTLETTFPEYFRLKYQDEPLSIRKIQGSLDHRTTAVEYFFADSVLYIFTVSKNSFDVTRTDDAAIITQAAKQLRKSLGTIDEKLYLSSAASLYRSIFLPIKEKLHGTQIVIIPDGNLYYIPFEALVSSSRNENGKTDFSHLPYLIKKYSISYSYSLALFINKKESPSKHKPKFVGFAPAFDDSTRTGTPSQGGIIAQSLEFSAKEVHQIEGLFQKKNFDHASFTEQYATKDNFKRAIGGCDYIHIASHGYADRDHPDLSALIFSRTNDSLPDDGVLYAGETYDLRLNADLVVLSSCESGVGQLVNGEGLMAMTRGFFYSGARNVIYSLWNVSDSHTNRLMVGFYDYLLSGYDIPTALQRAKLKMIQNDPGAFPSKWTSFVLLSTR